MANSISFPLTAPDLQYIDDVSDPLGSETTSEAQNLWQDLYHSLVCLPNGNPDAPGRGVGVLLYLSGTLTDLQGLPAKIEADFEQDFRVVGCAASLGQNPDGSYTIQILVQSVVGVLTFNFGYAGASGLIINPGSSAAGYPMAA